MPVSHANCTIIIDPAPRTGADNMRIDEQHLEAVDRGDSPPIVRIYTWESPTVSLGYFQKSVPVPGRFSECEVVRRLTGGGAILHDREITYSIALPPRNRFRSAPIEAYDSVHNAIISLLNSLGMSCEMRMHSEAEHMPAAKDEFLCFLRADPRDVVAGPCKIVGSAQRRRKGSILQHGSILMRHSSLTPEMPGIEDLFEEIDLNSFKNQLGEAIARAVT